MMSPQNTHRFDLPKGTPLYFGRQDFVIAYAAGKRVLHMGCADHGLAESKLKSGSYLHARLYEVCADLWGVDVDVPGIKWMKQQGWPNLFTGDIEELNLHDSISHQEFDLLVLTEVIEHLDNPGRFLQSIRPLFHSHTEMVITTPNALRLENFLANIRNQEFVHPDHNCWYSYHTLKALLTKYGYEITLSAVYTQTSYHHRMAGRFFKPPLQPQIPESIRPNADQSASKTSHRGRALLERIQSNATAFLHGFLLQRNPFFADGLIFVVKPTNPELQ